MMDLGLNSVDDESRRKGEGRKNRDG